MTDDRKIGILTPRARLQGAAHNLQAADRAQVSASPQPASAATRVQLAADVTTDLRGRARAAFRHAAFHEAVPTFSQFVANALEAEIKRIETEYNGGDTLQPVNEDLPRGRRTGS